MMFTKEPDLVLSADLEAVVPEPKPRSATWLTSTFPTGSEDPEAALCSGGYQVPPIKQQGNSLACIASPALKNIEQFCARLHDACREDVTISFFHAGIFHCP